MFRQGCRRERFVVRAERNLDRVSKPTFWQRLADGFLKIFGSRSAACLEYENFMKHMTTTLSDMRTGWQRVHTAEIAKNVAPSVIEANKAGGAAGGAAAGLGATIGGKLTEIGSGAVAQWLSEDKLDIIERINSILGKFTSGFENVAGIFRVLGVYASKFFDIISPYVTPVLVNILRAIEWALGGIGEVEHHGVKSRRLFNGYHSAS